MNNIARSPAPNNKLLNFSNIVGANTKNNGGLMNNIGKNISNASANVFNSVNSGVNVVSESTSNFFGNMEMIHWIILIIGIAILVTIGLFYKQIGDGFQSMMDSLKKFFGGNQDPVPIPPPDATPPVTETPLSVQDTNMLNNSSLVEKVLPGRKEVFNISSNRYSYYDAEPLCKALGAEVASFEQVKDAFEKGADWCNYGWVKGQMAVYPTQESTWQQLQDGPEDQRNACGNPGINGGYFDNPELRFGVNCYGVKPVQKDHDAQEIAKREGQPLTPGALEFEKLVAKYRGEVNSIGLLPFNSDSWASK